MFAAGTAVALLVALALDITGHGAAARGAFTVAGIVFLALAVFFPGWPRRRRDDRPRAQAPTCDDPEDRPDNRRSDEGDD